MSVSLTLKIYHSPVLSAWLGAPSKTISSVGVKPLRDHFLVTALATPTGWLGNRGSWDLGVVFYLQSYHILTVVHFTNLFIITSLYTIHALATMI